MDRLVAALGSNPDLLRLAVMGAAFVGALALLLALRYLLSARTNPLRDRLQRAVVAGPAAVEPLPRPLERRPAGSAWQRFLELLSRVARPSSARELGALRRKLSHAGFRGEAAVTTYLSVKIVLCVGAGLLFLWYNSHRQLPFQYAAFYTVILMGVGFYLPALWLHGRIKDRQTRINRALPDAMDLVVTCVEGGLGLDAALIRVAEELQLSSPVLSAELSQTSREMRAGMSRGESFRRLAERTGLEELRNLAAIIVQTELFGTSIARSLRVQADGLRTRRTQRAEERAATVAVKLTVPLILCIMPALFAVLMGPAVVRILRVLLPTLMGGDAP